MTPRHLQKLQRSLLPALLLFLFVGLQSALGCTAPAQTNGGSGLRVNACHLDYVVTKTDPCCDSVICHRSASPTRHLGSPEFANQIKEILPLILESRQNSPQPRNGLAFDHRLVEYRPTYPATTTSPAPRQALSFLRTTILLH
ncbi:MAG: hypothetical protein R6W66_05980 [Pelovirga sp.]